MGLQGLSELREIGRLVANAGYDDGRIRIAVGGTLPSRDLDRIVTHELVHALVAGAATTNVRS